MTAPKGRASGIYKGGRSSWRWLFSFAPPGRDGHGFGGAKDASGFAIGVGFFAGGTSAHVRAPFGQGASPVSGSAKTKPDASMEFPPSEHQMPKTDQPIQHYRCMLNSCSRTTC